MVVRRYVFSLIAACHVIFTSVVGKGEVCLGVLLVVCGLVVSTLHWLCLFMAWPRVIIFQFFQVMMSLLTQPYHVVMPISIPDSMLMMRVVVGQGSTYQK